MSTGRGPMFFSRVAQSPPVNKTDVTDHKRHCSQHVAFSDSTTHLNKTLLLTFNIFHDHAQVPPCLKGAVHGHHKGVFSKGKDVSLHKGLLYLIPQNQILLVDLFHGEPLLCLLVPNQIHSAVGTNILPVSMRVELTGKQLQIIAKNILKMKGKDREPHP